MTDKAPRTDWLNTLLGKGKAEEVIADTVAAADTLAQAGIMPKALKALPEEEEKKPEGDSVPAPESEETPPAPEPEKELVAPPAEGDMVAEVGTKLAQQIFDVAQGNLATLTQEQLGKVISDALRPAVEEEAPAPAPAAEMPPPEREEDMAGKSLDATNDKALGDMIVQMAKDQGEMARGYQELVAKAAAEKALAPVVAELVKAVEEIRSQIGDRPRLASRADETIVDATTEAGKAIKEAAEKGVNREKTFMGVKVKDIPK